jgi:Ca2+-transporting ATPase
MAPPNKIAATSCHALPASDVLERLKGTPSGLQEPEAARRLAQHGPNVLRRIRSVSPLTVLGRQLRSIVVALLVVAALASLVIGEPLDSAAIAVVLLINVIVGFATEMRAHRSMEALVRAQAPRAIVLRGGRRLEIAASDVVPGDVLRVEAGQAVAADARILAARDLLINEAPLTGESQPVAKLEDRIDEDTLLAARTNMLYQGTLVVAGGGEAIVTATGMHTEVGHIGELVAEIKDERTPIEERLDRLGHRLAAVALGCGVLMALVGLLRGFPLSSVVPTGIALAIAAVPEALPAVAVTALAVGIHRMARRQSLVRRPPAVETLGSVTVICTDKTGTLTAGEMSVRVLALHDDEIAISGAGYEPTGSFARDGHRINPAESPRLVEALRIGALVNNAGIEPTDDGWRARGDPTDAALLVAARRAGIDRDQLLRTHELMAEVPFASRTMMMAAAYKRAGGDSVLLVKGSPESVLQRCSRLMAAGDTQELTDERRGALQRQNEALAARGLRVVALARRDGLSTTQDELRDLSFVAFAGIIDPPASGAKEAIDVFRNAGIRVVMMTGDQKLTGAAVAAELGLASGDIEVLDGREIRDMSAGELGKHTPSVNVFSRTSPEDKVRIIDALRRNGEIVAMIGDGINDAAALRKAHVGVAMGIRGTDAAKEAAAIVLQDDRFASIGAAIEEGRVVYDNVRKFVMYLFSCNLAEVLVVVIAVAVGLPLPLLPLQLLWLNLVTDTFPALSLAMEPAESNVMLKPPLDPDRAILSRRFLGAVTLYAAVIAAVTLTALGIGLAADSDNLRHATTLSFMTLALAQVFHLANARQRGHVLSHDRALANPWALAAVALVVLLQIAAVTLQPLARILETEWLSARDWTIVLSLSLVPAVLGQLLRLRRQPRSRVPTA